MRFKTIIAFACCLSAFAQGDRGTITGTVTDPAGAIIANAAVEAKNLSTGAAFPATSTSAGLYTLSQLPIGPYEVTVTVPGFKKYVRSGLTVEVAQTIGLDVQLEVGAASESVTVNAEATLLKTETSDVSHNVTVATLNTLPILGTGSSAAGSSGVRNPNNVTILVPGTFFAANSNVKVNGAPTNTQRFNVEGMDSTNQLINFAPAQVQPSVDAVQEVAVQTSNFAAEFGSVGGGFFNVTMRSGTNQYHGSVYDYFSNEFLNAGTPYTDAGASDSLKAGQHIRPRARRHDYGLTLGGPVSIPKLYDGKDKTFFFFNWEQFRETQNINNIFQTVPTDAYRNGDFSGAVTALGNKVLTGTIADPLGRTFLANQIFDPLTRRTVNGQVVSDQFPNNTIPQNRFDAVAAKVQGNIPRANVPGAVFNNYLPSYPSVRLTGIPGLKLDQQIGSKGHLSFYWSRTRTDSQISPTFGNSEGFPDIITAARGTFIHSHVERLNYDHTISPTMLLHLGVGYQHSNFLDAAPITNFDAEAVYGLKGATVKRNTPNFTGFCPANVCTAAGGMQNMGPAGSGQVNQWQQKPGANASLTWVKSNHTYKFGGDWFNLGIPVRQYANTNGNYTFDPAQTAQPYLTTQTLAGGSLGFGYASFLLGQTSSVQIAPFSSYRSGKINLGFFAQDSWKATRKMTVDYGLRWDYGSAQRETYGRFADFSGTAINPVLNRPGAWVFGGSGPGSCNCELAQNYKAAFGPRLGVAYNINSKTVLRSGFGVVYGQTNVLGIGAAASGTINSTGLGAPALILADGIPASQIPVWPNKIPNLYPATGNPATLPTGVGQLDQNAGRPSRQMQWSIGLQRQITSNLVVEASYVGNRGVWWGAATSSATANTGAVNLNALTPQSLAARGIDVNNAGDLALLTQPLSSAAVQARGFGLPYTGFPTTQTLAQSLRPFPQLASIPVYNAPVGNTYYDSLQAKATKRFSHGFNATVVFTKQKSLQEGIENANGVFNNVFQRGNSKWLSSFDQPYTAAIAASYIVPRLDKGRTGAAKFTGYLLSEWQLGTLLQYASGRPIPVPASTTSLNSQLFQPTLAERIPGVALFNNDLNCHCYDISTNFPLNAAAWKNPTSLFSPSAGFYNDFRYQRRPSESINFGRTFMFGPEGRFKLNVRAEFSNMFNRAVINDPNVATSPLNPQTKTAAGATTGGFGFINRSVTGTQFIQPRQGTLIARFQF